MFSAKIRYLSPAFAHCSRAIWFSVVIGLYLGLGAQAQDVQKGAFLSNAPSARQSYTGGPLYPHSHALIVGINHYMFLPKTQWLRFAEQDAMDLRNLLIRSYGFSANDIYLLTGKDATKRNIEVILDSFADGGSVGEHDRVFIYFSGHGQTVHTGVGGEMGFLIPYDARIDLNHPNNRSGYFYTCIPMDDVWTPLKASAAIHALVVADACFGGLLAQSKRLSSEEPSSPVIASLLTRPAREVLTAGSSDESAWEDPSIGHGAFTYKLLEELRAHAANPDNIFTASELAAKLKTSVGNLTSARQTPQFGSVEGTEGDLIFDTTSPQSVPPQNDAAQAARMRTLPVLAYEKRLRLLFRPIAAITLPHLQATNTNAGEFADDGKAGSVNNARFKMPTPTIPDSMRSTPFNATVVLEIVLSADGLARGLITKSSGYPTLDQAALDAVSRMHFTPATRNGVPIDQTVRNVSILMSNG